MRKKRKQAEIAAPQVETKRVTPVDIQQKEFRLAMRGYNERDVDQFLDEVTEEVARLYADNKRLREEVDFGKTTRLETSGAAEAEGILRQAREEAARIIAEATARASTIGSVPAAGGEARAGSAAPPNEIMGIFLARERAFLQNMANLIQAHAEGVKQDVRRVREQVPPRPPAVDAPVGSERPVHEAPSTAEEPTRAWEAVSDESSRDEPGPETEPRRDEVVDLTRGDEGAAQTSGGSPAGGPGEAALSQAAMSSVYGRPEPSTETKEASRRSGEASPSRPRVEDDDAREDRSIRELFWGED